VEKWNLDDVAQPMLAEVARVDVMYNQISQSERVGFYFLEKNKKYLLLFVV